MHRLIFLADRIARLFFLFDKRLLPLEGQGNLRLKVPGNKNPFILKYCTKIHLHNLNQLKVELSHLKFKAHFKDSVKRKLNKRLLSQIHLVNRY